MSSILGRASTIKSNRKANANLDMASGRPTDLLEARGEQWKAIVKGLLTYYEGLAAAEKHQGSEITKHAGDLPLPFSASSQFTQDGDGWQPTLYKVRDHTRRIADLHEGLAKKIDQAVVAELTSIKAEVKSYVHNMHEDAGKKADVVDKEREASTAALGKLGHAVGTVGQLRSQAPTAAEDPFIAHSVVERQLAQQVVKENELQTSTLRFQRDMERLEQDWSTRIQTISKTYAEVQADFSERIRQENEGIAKLIAGVPADGEWKTLTSSENNYLIPQDAPMRDINQITFPSQNHESTKIVKSGTLERKTRLMKKYEEVHLVLTAGGFLHAYDKDPTTAARQDDPKSVAQPTISLFLPNSTLGPPAPASSSKHKFYIEGVKSGVQKQSKFKLGSKKDKDYTFRAHSHSDMLAWHEAIEKLCGNSISVDANTPSSASHKGEVPSTVSGVGLADSSAASTTTGTAADEEESGSSEEEEEEGEFVEATTPGETTSANVVSHSATTDAGAATDNGELPGYQSHGAVVPPEKKAHFDDEAPISDRATTENAAGSSKASSDLPAPIAGASSTQAVPGSA